MSDAHGVARDQLRAFVERIERLEEEKKTIADDIKDVYGEAKSMGFDTKILKKVIALRKKDEQERTEEEMILDTYLQALGMIPQIELFNEEEAPVAKRQPAMALQSPRKAAEAVSERTAIKDEAFSSDLVDVITEAEARVSGQPELTPALTGQLPGVNVGGPARAGVTGGESAATGQAAGNASGLSENSPETADEVPAQDGEGTGLGESLSGKSDTARPASVDAQPNGRGSAGQVEESVVTVVGTESGTVSHSENAPAAHGSLTYEDFPPFPMKRTSFAHCFPELSARDYDALGTDIGRIGVQDPIVRHGKVILDGWARYNIARNLGIQYPVVAYDGEDELLDVIRWQRTARNFTPAQSKKIAADLAKEVPHRASEIMAAFEIEMEDA